MAKTAKAAQAVIRGMDKSVNRAVKGREVTVHVFF